MPPRTTVQTSRAYRLRKSAVSQPDDDDDGESEVRAPPTAPLTRASRDPALPRRPWIFRAASPRIAADFSRLDGQDTSFFPRPVLGFIGADFCNQILFFFFERNASTKSVSSFFKIYRITHLKY